MTDISDKKMLLRAKIEEKRIQRNNKHAKDIILEKTLKQMGIDKKKFQEDMDLVKKQGGLEMNLKI